MKKIAIVYGKIGPNKREFLNYLHKNLKNVAEVVSVIIGEITIFMKTGEVRVEYKKESIGKFNIVYFRRIGDKNLSIAYILSNYLRKKGIKVIDKTLVNVGRGDDKETHQFILSQSKVPVIPTVYSANWEDIVKTLETPVIAKNVRAQRMEGVFILRNKSDYQKLLKEYPDSRFNYQKFMDIEKEFRLLVMGNKVRTVLVKDKRLYGKFKVGVPNGIPEEYLDVDSFPEKLKKIAVEAAHALDLEVAGVDLMIEKGTSMPFIIEVNRGPGITTDIKNSPELPELAKYLKEELENVRS